MNALFNAISDQDDDDDQDVSVLLALLAPPLREWYSTPTWPASREWLTANLDRLPTDSAEVFEAVAARAVGAGAPRAATLFAQHAALIARARQDGVDAAYTAIVGDSALANAQPDELAERLTEFFSLARRTADPVRQVALGQRILALDAGERLTSEGRFAVLLTLGNALQSVASMRGGYERIRLLRQARACFEAAARERPRESAPLEWAAATASAAAALGDLAGTQGGRERQASLRAALVAYDLALVEYRRDVAPTNWATTQNNKAAALRALAGTQGG
ncbi:MAG TPA: hypothetical protein VJN88_11635, partial [Ktedonobacterales bacterium]|nr:hypothetical protein [Ktedonobacterales bacterium]